MLLRNCFVVITLLLLAACSSKVVPPVAKSEIQTEIVAKANGSGETTIEATLQVTADKKPAKDIDIELPYTLQARVGNQTRTLYKTLRDGETVYSTTLPTDSTKEKYFVGTSDKKPQNSFIVLPKPFHITSSLDKDFDRNQDINITWDNANKNGSIDVGFALTCVGQGKPSVVIIRKKVNDSGKLLINASELVDGPDVKVDTSQGCEAMVILSRKTEKSLNPLFGKGSYSLGVQERSANFSIKPKSA